MIQVIQEVLEPQSKIVFITTGGTSFFLRVPEELQLFNKSDFIECDRELNLSQFTRQQVIEAFERLEEEPTKKRSQIITALDGNGD